MDDISSNGEEKVDVDNYKGIFYNTDQENKIKDEATGAHFLFKDMCNRLLRIAKQRETEQSAFHTRMVAIKYDPKYNQRINTHAKK